jgi:aspartate aminotransferase
MVAHRAREVDISGIRRMFEAAPPTAINLGLGEPNFEPPGAVLDAFCHAVRNGGNHYGPSAGLPALRKKIAERYRARAPETGRDNVIITAGGSEALMATAFALYDPGDEILVPDPGFVLYAPHARLLGAVPVAYELDEKRAFLPDVGSIERLVTARTRVIVINSPSNPTGAVLPEKTVAEIIALAERHDLHIVSDEVYDQIVYDRPVTSFWGRTDRAVVVNSFSKTLAATGWRVGFLVAPRALAVEINKMHYHIIACASTPAQSAVLAGLESGLSSTRAMTREFRARRAIVLRELARCPGMTCVPPAGAFYAFPRFSWPETSTEAAQALLSRGLITTPGDAFGSRGAKHLRISFAASRTDLVRGLAILREYAQEAVRA